MDARVHSLFYPLPWARWIPSRRDNWLSVREILRFLNIFCGSTAFPSSSCLQCQRFAPYENIYDLLGHSRPLCALQPLERPGEFYFICSFQDAWICPELQLSAIWMHPSSLLPDRCVHDLMFRASKVGFVPPLDTRNQVFNYDSRAISKSLVWNAVQCQNFLLLNIKTDIRTLHKTISDCDYGHGLRYLTDAQVRIPCFMACIPIAMDVIGPRKVLTEITPRYKALVCESKSVAGSNIIVYCIQILAVFL